MEDRRQEDRLNWGSRLTIEDQSGKAVSTDSRLKNLNKSGFGFVTEDHLNRGQVYRFKMMLGTTELSIPAKIIHFHIEATYYVCGARIEGLSIWQRSQINRLLASKSEKLKKRFLVRSVAAGLVAAVVLKFLMGSGVGLVATAFFGVTILCFLLMPF